MKAAFAVAFAVAASAQLATGQPTSNPDAAAELHLKAVRARGNYRRP